MDWLSKYFKKKKENLREKYFRKFVFVHINRTACTSIERALGLKTQHETAMEQKIKLGNHLWYQLVSQYAYRVMRF